MGLFNFRCYVPFQEGRSSNYTTPPKFNIAPEKRWLEDDYFPIGKVTFQGRTVRLREGITSITPVNVNEDFSCKALKLMALGLPRGKSLPLITPFFPLW